MFAKKALIVADFPPPLTGLSLVTDWVKAELIQNGFAISSFNTTTPKGVFRPLKRIMTYLRALQFILASKGRSDLYIPLHHGASLMGQSLIIVFGLMRTHRVLVHHHSYYPITEPKKILHVSVHGMILRKCEHVFLSEDMRSKYVKIWGAPKKTWVVNNFGVVNKRFKTYGGSKLIANENRISVVHASNLSTAKGSLFVLSLFQELLGKDSSAVCTLLGPTKELLIIKSISDLSLKYPKRFHYIPNYATQDLAEILSQSQIFIFPSTYKNEAAPLAVIEAQFFGNIVISSNIGALPEIIFDPGAFVEIEKFRLKFFEVFSKLKKDPKFNVHKNEKNKINFDDLSTKAENSILRAFENLDV